MVSEDGVRATRIGRQREREGWRPHADGGDVRPAFCFSCSPPSRSVLDIATAQQWRKPTTAAGQSLTCSVLSLWQIRRHVPPRCWTRSMEVYGKHSCASRSAVLTARSLPRFSGCSRGSLRRFCSLRCCCPLPSPLAVGLGEVEGCAVEAVLQATDAAAHPA